MKIVFKIYENLLKFAKNYEKIEPITLDRGSKLVYVARPNGCTTCDSVPRLLVRGNLGAHRKLDLSKRLRVRHCRTT